MRLSLLFVVLAVLAASAFAQTITINPSSPLQPIDGFGADSTGDGTTTTPSATNTILWTDAGINLSIVRTGIMPDKAGCEAYRGVGNCVTVPSGAATLPIALLTNLQAAVSAGVSIVLASSGFPPNTMETDCNGGAPAPGGSGCWIDNPTNNAAWSATLANFVRWLYTTYGIQITHLSVQNEPDVFTTNYPTSYWSPQSIHDFVPYLHAALAAAGESQVKIVMAEEGSWATTVSAITMNDASVAPYVSVLAAHGYPYPPAASLLSYSNVTTQHQWETESSDIFNVYDGSIANALTWATIIHNWLTVAKVNAWFPFLGWQSTNFGNNNQGLTPPGAAGGVMAMRAYALGNWSKFVRPGCNMVSLGNPTGLLVTAFSCPSSTVTVVINNSGSAATNQLVSGMPGTQITPWITSATYNLQSQSPVSISGNAFTYTIPANSIVTLVSNHGSAPLNGGIAFSGAVQIQ